MASMGSHLSYFSIKFNQTNIYQVSTVSKNLPEISLAASDRKNKTKQLTYRGLKSEIHFSHVTKIQETCRFWNWFSGLFEEYYV